MTATSQPSTSRVIGDWQHPKNLWQGAENSIHTDSVAQKIGMRGGTIPGTVHLTHFVPIIKELFGERWLKTGSISMYYTYATINEEPVRAVVEAQGPLSPDVQLNAWVETPEGKTVCKGTLACGKPDAVPYVRSLTLENAAPGASRILAQAKLGAKIAESDYTVKEEGGKNGILVDPQLMFRALQVAIPVKTAPAVGFFGATEVMLHNGPIETGKTYRKSGQVACIGASPKTEFIWMDSFLHDKDGKVIAEMRHMTRWMKVSSPLWAA